MRIGLIGSREAFAAFLQQAAAAGHELVAAGDTWESFAETGDYDVALLGRGPEPAVTQSLRSLIAADIPTLTAPGLLADPLDYYELDAVREEQGAGVWSYRPRRSAAGAERLAEMVRQGDDGPLGPLEQIVVERVLSPSDEPAWRGAFSDDVDVIRAVAGEIEELVALGSLDREGDRLAIQLQGAAGWSGRWEAAAGRGDAWSVTVQGRFGRTCWRWRKESNDDETASILESPGKESETLREEFSATKLLDELVAAKADAPCRWPTWQDDCRALEIAAGAARSLQRGRRVDVRFEPADEMDNFKSLMTAAGCGLVLFTPVVLGAAGVAAFAANQAAAGWAQALLDWIPAAVLAVLLLFLLVQSIVWLAPRREDGQESAVAD